MLKKIEKCLFVLCTFAVLLTVSACEKEDTPQSSTPPPNSSSPTSATPKTNTSASPTSNPDLITSAPFPTPPVQTKPDTRFRQLSTAESGVNLTIPIDKDHPMSRLYLSGYMPGGVAIGDIDNDGKLDLFFGGGSQSHQLYRQTDNLKFERIDDKANLLKDAGWCSGVAMIDIDQDHDLDLYVCRYEQPNLLYINDGKGKFTEAARQWGIDFSDASLMPSFEDYDRDGDLDLYIICNRLYRPGGRPAESPIDYIADQPVIREGFDKYYSLDKTGEGKYEINNTARTDKLYRNEGNGKFVDVSIQAGIKDTSHGLSATWWDYNNDNLPDLYVANDFDDDDILYHNNGDGTFTNVIKTIIPHTSWSSMGSDAGDLNNDGYMDFIVADMAATNHYMSKVGMGNMGANAILAEKMIPPQQMRNAVYINTGTNRMMESAFMSHLAKTDWTWAVKLADYNLDGHLDAFFSNGVPRNFADSDNPLRPAHLVEKTEWEHYKDLKPRKEKNLVFENEGHLKFHDVSKKWGLDFLGISYAAAHGDLDNDGDLDLVVVNVDDPVHIYQNQSTNPNRIKIKLNGRKGNLNGTGATVKIVTPTSKQMRTMQPYTGFASNNENAIYFGLGKSDQINTLEVHWPSGTYQRYNNLKPGFTYTITEPQKDKALLKAPQPPKITPMYTESDHFKSVMHQEKKYDDFKHQPLLPNRLSQLGPGIAIGDIDADGDKDIFVGGAAGRQAYLLKRTEDGQYERQFFAALLNHEASEDMGALFFDADSDGDLDLYVASGSYEFAGTEEALRDRLYLNNGNGQFQHAPDNLPDQRHLSSVVAAADYDRDGDLDLFVGSRVKARAYPLAPDSSLLVNDKGKFTEQATEVGGPALAKPGLVTGAVWSDINNDGWVDLLVTCEWGPVKIFMNQNGKLVDQTEKSGIGQQLGWWNAITPGDIDNDGDTDFIVANFGLNTKYHASPEKPALIYYGDFEEKGRYRLVEAEFEGKTLFPIRGRSCSSQAMPFIKTEFKTYHDFALSSVEEIYTPEKLKQAHRFACHTLHHIVMINDGNGQFKTKPLHSLSQISPAFGMKLLDVDHDGNLDLYMLHNFYTPQIETGRMDSGVSLLLRGDGKGGFNPVWPNHSGLVVGDDAKSLGITDLNNDAQPDFIVVSNNSQVKSFIRNHPTPPTNPPNILTLKLLASNGNTHAVGAHITATTKNKTTHTTEIYAGEGYLSQTTPNLHLLNAKDNPITQLQIRWPDGNTTQHQVKPDQQTITIKQQ